MNEFNGRGLIAADAPNAIEVDHIVKRYGSFLAVDDISFAVKEGEIFGLLGPNGAGKSTLIRMMTTLIPITAGTARVAGHDVARDPNAVRHTIGVIPQALTSDLDLTVEENLNIYAKLYDVPAKRRKEAIAELLETVDLTKWRDAQTKTLSGGMRRRLEIARGLVHSPKIFFLDEPTTGLDPVSRVSVWEMLTSIKAKRKLTILITTHYMDEAEYCNRLVLLDRGRIVAMGTPTELKSQHMKGQLLMIECLPLGPALELLQTVPEVLDAAVFGSGIHAVVADAAVMAPKIRELLLARQFRPGRIEQIAPSLEDVFVSLTAARGANTNGVAA